MSGVSATGVYDGVVVGSDGSQTSCRAVEQAALYGEAFDTEVTVATAFRRPTEGEVGPASQRATMPRESMASSGARAAADIAADAAAFGRRVAPAARVRTAAFEGDPADALIDLASGYGDALLVVGNKGMTGSKRFMLGSVPNKVSHHATGDVLITRSTDDVDVRLPQRILIATDGSGTATRAVQRGLAVAAAVKASVTILTAGMGRSAGRVLDSAGALADDAGVAWEGVDAPGDAADEIVEASDGHDLVVVGNKGMTGATRFLLGSVPNKVSHHVAADLLIVRTT